MSQHHDGVLGRLNAPRYRVALLLLNACGLSRTWGHDGPAIDDGKVRETVQRYQNVLTAHADIICEYEMMTRHAESVAAALNRTWIPESPQFTNRGIYKSQSGKVLARELSLDQPAIVGEKMMRGATTEFLTNGKWRTLHNPDFRVLTVASRENFANDRWGPSFTPWSMAVMGNTAHLPGSENVGVCRHILENLGTPAAQADATTIDMPRDDVLDAALRVTIASRSKMGTRKYYFTTPTEFGVPLLSMFELYTGGSNKPHTVAFVVEYGLSPYELPFPMKCLRVSYPRKDGDPFNSVWIEVNKLTKSDTLTHNDFRLAVMAGETATVEGIGFAVRIEENQAMGFDLMPRIQQRVLKKRDAVIRKR